MGEPASAQRLAGRNQSVELLRIISCFGIVAFHAHAGSWDVCYTGLTVFLILTAYFEASAKRPSDPLGLARKLLIPWSAWTVVYAAIDIVRHKAVLPGSNLFLGLLEGPSPHLWYLPFAFAGLLAIGQLKEHRRGLLYGAAIVACGMLLTCTVWRRADLPAPLVQYLQALGPICIGVLWALVETIEAKLLAVVVGICLLFAVAARVSGISVEYGLGAIAVGVALAWRIPGNVQPVSRHMFAVYLMHPAMLSVAHAAHLGGWPAVLAAFMASLLIAEAWRRLAPALRKSVIAPGYASPRG